MKTYIDEDVCIGCGLCAGECPEVYEMKGDKAAVISETVSAELENCADSAAAQCPVEAITIE